MRFYPHEQDVDIETFLLFFFNESRDSQTLIIGKTRAGEFHPRGVATVTFESTERVVYIHAGVSYMRVFRTAKTFSTLISRSIFESPLQCVHALSKES